MKDFPTKMIKYECIGKYELALQLLHISFAINKKKYSKVKSEKIYVIDALNTHNGKYTFDKIFIKLRHAKKAYKKMKKDILK